MAKTNIKCMVVGDCDTSKLSTVLRYTTGQFTEEWTPTVYDSHNTKVTVDEDTVAVNITAVSGLSEYDIVRLKLYPGTTLFTQAGLPAFRSYGRSYLITVSFLFDKVEVLLISCERGFSSEPGMLQDAFMVCFSLMDRVSISTVGEKWVPEIREFSQHVPFILVGTKMDLRSDEQTVQNLWDVYQQKPITTAEGEQLAASVGAGCYMECSAKTGENVKETMEQMARLALAARRHDRKSSTHCHIV